MTSTMTDAATLPDMIEVNGDRFFKTPFTSITMRGHFWGEGVEAQEYWRDGKDDCRLQVRTADDHYID